MMWTSRKSMKKMGPTGKLRLVEIQVITLQKQQPLRVGPTKKKHYLKLSPLAPKYIESVLSELAAKSSSTQMPE
jgi:hypothetical protein